MEPGRGSHDARPPAPSLSRRVLAAFAVVVLAFAATVAAGLTAQQRARQDVVALSLGYLPLETALASARAAQWTVAARLDSLRDDPDAAGTTRQWLETVARGRPTIFSQAREAAQNDLGEAADESTRVFGRDVADELDAIERDLAENARVLPDLFGAMQSKDAVKAGTLLSTIAARERAAAQRLDALANRIGDRRRAVVEGSVKRDERAMVVSISLALFSLVVAALATREVRRRLSPLGLLKERAQAMAAGDRSPLPSELAEKAPRDEIGELATAFGAMVEGVASRDADLSRLRRFQEDIVNHLRAAVIAASVDGVVEAANPAARALFGVEVGHRLADDAPRLWSLVAADVAHAIERGQEPPARTAVTLETAGEVPRAPSSAGAEARVVDLRVVPMRADRERSRLALIVGDDVSEAAVARARALQAERLAAIGKMAAHITHEIRNPLSSIGLNVELLEETLARGEAHQQETKGKNDPNVRSIAEARRLLAAIAREVVRLSDVSEDYLRVARLPSPRPTSVDLAELVRDVVSFARPELDRARVVLALDLPSEPVVVPIDEAQIRQALVNLVRNAREAMDDGGKLSVSLSVDRGDERFVRLEVADEGLGIAEDVRQRIFDPFFTTKSTGTGLGLPLTKQILEAHGGTIAYVPNTPRGSRFVLTFPRALERPSSLLAARIEA